MTDTASDIRREMATTRDRMAHDVEELKSHVTAPLRSTKERLDVAKLVREHPWPALGAAVVLGAVIGGSGADEQAASATVAGAKRAARASKEAATSAMHKLHSSESDEAVAPVEMEKPGISTRVADALGVVVARGLDRVLEELRVASHSWGQRTARPQSSGVAAASTTAIGVARDESTTPAPSAADTVPVPNEILPAELGLRANAVEALGGGTHEPPLAPGAGELGARWA